HNGRKIPEVAPESIYFLTRPINRHRSTSNVIFTGISARSLTRRIVLKRAVMLVAQSVISPARHDRNGRDHNFADIVFKDVARAISAMQKDCVMMTKFC